MSEAPTARSSMGDLPHPAHHTLPFDSSLILDGCQTQSLTSNFEPPPQDSYVATLLVRHLSEAVPYDVLSRLFSHYGASSLRPCSGGRLRNCAFIDFKDEISASHAQSQLHRLRFLGKVLSVERIGKKVPDSNHHRSEGSDTAYAVKGSGLDTSLSGNLPEESVGTYLMSEAIAPKLGVDYPFPSHLEYAYPPPDGNILTNIVNALIAVPRFYTQVLHLMNKMNIPAPFRVALPTPPLPTAVTFQPPPPSSSPPPLPNLPSPRLEDLSSDESELESPEEGDANESDHLGKNYTLRKRRRKQSIVGPAVDKGVAHEAVGLKPAALVPKEVPMIKKKSSVLQIKIAPKSLQRERSPPESCINVKIVPTCDESEERPFATSEEIEAGKLPAEEILSLPMFKNFIPGNPTPVLYIKNLAKNVVHEDFYFIFGSVFGNIELTKRSLDIKLMQEGRMKGQAFVTFPSIDLANKALNLVNGYVYKGKPMIIQFGRNSAAVMKEN